ncbi:MAG: acyl-ACP thioesterase [Rikenellaceae bacterium]|nr:acyl-ACP thioesterase [Rikenellaceae bacterium]
MAGIYQFKVEQGSVDGRGRAKVGFLNNAIVNVAGTDADISGFGIGDVNQENCSWVLSRYAVQFDRIPMCDEVISVDTWIGHCEKFFSVRNFVLRDAEGVQIGSAISLWALINIATRRPMMLEEMHARDGVAFVEREEPMTRPAKIGNVTPDITAEHRVVYSDVDFNGHMNSMRSIEHLTDLLPYEELLNCKGYRLDINFSREGLPGQMLTLACQRGDVNLFDVSCDGVSLTKASMQLF